MWLMHFYPNVSHLKYMGVNGLLCCFHFLFCLFVCLEELSAFHLGGLKEYWFCTVFCEVLYKCHRERCPSFKELLNFKKN